MIGTSRWQRAEQVADQSAIQSPQVAQIHVPFGHVHHDGGLVLRKCGRIQVASSFTKKRKSASKSVSCTRATKACSAESLFTRCSLRSDRPFGVQERAHCASIFTNMMVLTVFFSRSQSEFSPVKWMRSEPMPYCSAFLKVRT